MADGIIFTALFYLLQLESASALLLALDQLGIVILVVRVMRQYPSVTRWKLFNITAVRGALFVPCTAGLFFGPMASYVPSFASHYVGSKSSKQALVVRFRNAQADRIRVSCSRPRTAFLGSSCRCPRPSRLCDVLSCDATVITK
jgi:hypothetical protein